MEWVEVPREKFLAPHTERIRNVELQVFVAPHDVPRKVRGAFDQSKDLFVIEFRYLDEEHFDIPHISDDGMVTFFVGTNSGRLGRIEVDVKTMSAATVSLKIGAVQAAEHHMQSFGSRLPSLSSRMNFQAAREALELSSPQFA